jgi:hypothetical protein
MCFGGKGGAFSRPDRGIIDFRRPFGPGTGGLLPLFVLVPPVGGRWELAGGGASSASTGVPNAMDFRRDDWLRPLGSGIEDSVVRRLRDELLIVDGADSLEGKSTRPLVLSSSRRRGRQCENPLQRQQSMFTRKMRPARQRLFQLTRMASRG